MVLKWIFAQMCAFQWTKCKRALEEISITSRFLDSKKAKINYLKKIRVLSATLSN